MTTCLSELDFEELDDIEFAIPSIDGPLPTLDSILNEEDNDSVESEVELDANDGNNGIKYNLYQLVDSTENSSISSFDSKGLKKSWNDSNPNRAINGSVVRHSILKGLSAQLMSANTDRINAGKPTVLTVSSAYVAVGTSHGFVLVFDLRQVMKSCLRTNDDLGSVSAMAVKRDNSRLICGYSRGSVTLWNLQSGELIKVLNELHSPQTSVLHLKYMSDNNFGALSDSTGSVFMLDFRRKEVDSQCIFSGSRGEVLAIEPLLLPTNAKTEIGNFNNICLLSMATVTKVIAISLRPTITVHFTQMLKGDLASLPLLSWQFVMVQIAQDSRVIDPVLAFGRQNNIYFFQASFKSSSKILFIPLMQIRVEYLIQSIVWMNSRTIVTIDEFEKMHVLDVRSEEELEVIEIDKIELVYGSAHFKSLANGANVSRAMSTGADRACYHSICVSNSTLSNTSSSNLLILGINSVHLFTIRSWTERIDLLVEENRYGEALELSLSFYNNSAKAVIGLSGKKAEKRKFVAQKMIEILNKYVDSSLTSLCPEKGKIELLIEHFRQLIPTCIDYCLVIENNYQMLYNLFERFCEDSIARNIFLESLESHALKGELRNLSPIIAKELIIYYEEHKWFHTLEAIVTHLEITSLDIHYVMTVCRKHSLFDAIIYIHNQAFDDYITPFDELIAKIHKLLKSGKRPITDQEINLGNKLLIYLNSLLRGLSYPNRTDIEPKKKAILVKEILSRLMREEALNCSQTDSSNHYFNASEDNIYPNLKILLSFDSKQFLNIMLNAFESFDSENSFLTDQKQRFVDILVKLMAQNSGFDANRNADMFIFIAKLLSNKRNTICINNTLLEEIIEFLFVSEDKSSFEEREYVLLELLQSEAGLLSDQNKVLEMAKSVHFFRICEYIYVKNKNWGQNLSSYIRDSKRKSYVFDYINQIIMSSNVTENEKIIFIENVYSNIESLVEIDSNKSSKFVLDYLQNENLDNVLSCLESNPKVLYKLLFAILVTDSNKCHKRDVSNGSIHLESLSVKEQRKQTLITDPLIQERLIELMCQFEPNSVYKCLSLLDNYRSEVVLVLCKNYNIREGMAYLMEKLGSFGDAFDLLHKDLVKVVKDFVDSEIAKFWDQIESKMLSLIDFCRRCSPKMVEPKDREALWLTLLESMLTINQLVKSSAKTHPFEQNYCNNLIELMNKLINGMIGTINLTSVIETIVNDPSYCGGSGGTVCDLRELFLIVLENYNYEKTLLQTTNNMLLNELHQKLAQLTRDAMKANSNRLKLCSLCAKPLNLEDNLLLFRCSHCFHHKCLDSCQSEPKCVLCETPTDVTNDTHNPSRNCDQNIGSNPIQSNSLKLSETQLNSLAYLRKGHRIDSRANILNHLPNTGIRLTSNESKIDDIFKLKLAPKCRQIDS